jgi:hypothetical protein
MIDPYTAHVGTLVDVDTVTCSQSVYDDMILKLKRRNLIIRDGVVVRLNQYVSESGLRHPFSCVCPSCIAIAE